MSIPISGTNYSDVDGNYQRNIQIDGKQIIYQEDNTPPIPNDSGSITWNDFFKLVTNLDAVGNTPNATTLKVENTLLLDNGVNTRTITATSNPATTITVAVTNENQTFYPVFADGDGTSKTLLVDDATTTLSYNPSTSQLACSQVNADIQSVASTQNATHYIGMYDSSSTGYGRPQKSSGLTFNPSTRVLTVTDGTNSTVITPTSNSATGITISSLDTAGTYYPVFTDGTGTNKSMLIDSATTSLTYNPNTSTLSATTFSGTSTGIQLTGNSANAERSVPFSNSSVGGARTLLIDTQSNPFQYNAGLQRLNVPYIGLTNTIDNTPTFSTGTLTLNTTSNTFSYYNWSFNQTTASGNITALTLTNFRAGGIYVLFFTNSSGGAITWNTGLGANILTNYSTNRTLNNGSKAVIKILFDGTTYYIEYTGY